MDLDGNKAIVRRFADECWGRGTFEAADQLVAEHVVRNAESIGRVGLLGVIAGIRSALPDFHTQIEDLVAERDKVAWRYSSGGTHTGAPLLGIPAAGRVVSWTGMAMLRIEGGQITEIWDSVDLSGVAAQLGATSPDARSPTHPS